MKLQRINVKNFRSYKGEQSLALDQLPAGFYLVRGANGAGKSTLFDAVHWALFGETSRGLRASSINSWGTKKGCEVSLKLDDSEVARGWSPNYLRVDGDEVDQRQLEQALRLTPEVALNTFYFSQFAEFFLDLKPPQRMEIYSEVLGLRLWEEKSELASKLAKDYAEDAQRLEVEVARARERAAALLSVDHSVAAERWKKERQAEVSELQREAEALEIDLLAEKETGARLRDEVKKLKAKAEAARKRSEQAKLALRESERSLSAYTTDLKVVTSKLQEANEDLLLFLDLGQGACPSCGQPITPAHKAKHAKELKAKAAALQSKHATAVTLEKEARKAADAAERALDAADPSPALRAAEAAQRQEEASKTKLEEISTKLAAVKKKRTSTSTAPNPFLQQQLEQRKQVKAANELGDEKQAELEEARTLQAAFAFWVRGFKDVRFQIMQESLAQLNAEVNECIHDLGLEDWELRFEVEHETAKGTVKRGFLCTVLSPGSPEGVPWEAWSGGESQRLRVAAQMGVSNMICSRLGLSPDFEFWDEPSTWLNDEGIKAMLSVLQERAERYERRIFIADHRALDFDFDGVLDVVKKEGGSELATSW